jgi:hypothetical protein
MVLTYMGLYSDNGALGEINKEMNIIVLRRN